MSRKVKLQWQTLRPKMMNAICDSAAERRTRFEDLTEESFSNEKIDDGRFYAWYWDGDKKRTIYRYQWRWILKHGPIPKGFILHHKDEIPYHDDCDNLELMTPSEHATLHNSTRDKSEWICQYCGSQFVMPPRTKGEPRKFCSKKCHYDFIREYSMKCDTYEAANEYTEQILL